MAKRVLEIQRDVSELFMGVNNLTFTGACDELGIGDVEDIPSAEQLKIATEWLHELAQSGATYTLYRQIAAILIKHEAWDNDADAIGVHMRSIRDSLNTADVTLEQFDWYGGSYRLVCPLDTDDAMVDAWANQISTLLMPLKNVISEQAIINHYEANPRYCVRLLNSEMPSFAAVTFPANFKIRFFHERFLKFKETIANLTVEEFASKQEMAKIAKLIASADDDVVWCDAALMPFSEFVCQLDGEEQCFVNLSYATRIQ